MERFLLIAGISTIALVVFIIISHVCRQLFTENLAVELPLTGEPVIDDMNTCSLEEDIFCMALRKSLLSRLEGEINEQLVTEIEFLPPNGKAKLKAYCPKLFNKACLLCGVKRVQVISSLTAPLKMCSFELGKGKSIFISTSCGTFLLKTLRNSEPRNLLAVLNDYIDHLQLYKDSLLPRYLGLFEFKIDFNYTRTRGPEFSNSYFIVLMKNWFSATSIPQLRFDFKGSSVGRAAGIATHDATDLYDGSFADISLKEIDFFDLVKSNRMRPLILDRQCKLALYSQIIKDTEFLVRENFMDYSILVGVYKFSNEHHISLDLDNTSRFHSFLGGMESLDGRSVYIFGLVDCLQRFSMRKRVEKLLKNARSKFIHSNSEYFKIPVDSVEHPVAYAHRLTTFVNDILISF